MPKQAEGIETTNFSDSDSYRVDEEHLSEKFNMVSRPVDDMPRDSSALSNITRFTESKNNDQEFVVHHFVSKDKKRRLVAKGQGLYEEML